jgi:hypothetical protein
MRTMVSGCHPRMMTGWAELRAEGELLSMVVAAALALVDAELAGDEVGARRARMLLDLYLSDTDLDV